LKPVHHGEILLFRFTISPDHARSPGKAARRNNRRASTCHFLLQAEGRNPERSRRGAAQPGVSNDLIGEANLYGIREIQGKILP
jgi:hypothetical protein